MRDVAHAPWHWTLWSFRELMDVERRDRLEKEHDQLRSGVLTHYAVNAPGNLEDELNSFRDRAGLSHSREDALKHAEATVEAMKRAKKSSSEGAANGD